jgi:quinol monooxygenase YgiN
MRLEQHPSTPPTPPLKNNAEKILAFFAPPPPETAVAQEPGTLMYEWNFRSDQKTFDVIELYQSSEAALAHVKHVVAEFGKDLGQVQKGLQLTIYGSPDAQVKQAVEGFNPVYQTHFEGFIR